MTTPLSIITELLPNSYEPAKPSGYGEAPVNIALIKYWGKRCPLFNLPVTDSLSVTVPDTLTRTHIRVIEHIQDVYAESRPKSGYPQGAPLQAERPAVNEFKVLSDDVRGIMQDRIILNQQVQSPDSTFAKRLSAFLDFFRSPATPAFEVDTQNTVATAAGLASSASGFAALVLALNDFFGWQLDDQSLSILARLGSGSACRSLWPGFVHWQVGVRPDGLDSYAKPLSHAWPGLMLGLVIVESYAKPISSREAMTLTTQTSPLYQAWPATVTSHLHTLLAALAHQDFASLGTIAEQNALAMHATMLASWPSVDYRIPATWMAIQQVYQLRREGVPVYFTQDAGPNIKLLFEAKDLAAIQAAFPTIAIKSLFTASI